VENFFNHTELDISMKLAGLITIYLNETHSKCHRDKLCLRHYLFRMA
jgi:hypothetical protein